MVRKWRVSVVNHHDFRIDSGVRQGCIMSPRLFNVYMDGYERGENGGEEKGTVISGGGEKGEAPWPLVYR